MNRKGPRPPSFAERYRDFVESIADVGQVVTETLRYGDVVVEVSGRVINAPPLSSASPVVPARTRVIADEGYLDV